MISRHGLVRSGHAHGLSTVAVRADHPENCTGRTRLNNYVTGVVVFIGPWGLDEWANWKELNKWGVKERALR